MTHMNVTPEEITNVANTLDGYVNQLQNVSSQVQSATLPSGAFGHIPGLSSHMDGTYTQHVQQSQNMLTLGTQGLDAVEKSMLATANGMLEVEKNTADTLNQTMGG